MEAMGRLSAHLRNRPTELRELKGNGVKVAGYFPGDYVPEELIYASGAVPLCLIHGGHCRAVDATFAASSPYLCVFARAQFGERLLQEQPYYNMIDLLVAPISCQNLRMASDMWAYYTDVDVFRLGVPHEYDSDHGLQYYSGMLRLLKEKLEKLTGNEIEDGKITEGVALYNRMRELLKEISLMRKAERPPLTALDFVKLNHASFYADPTFMVGLLDSLCHELKQQEGNLPQEGPRLLLVGPNIAYGDSKVMELIEEAGGVVVAEEISEGIRCYWQNVEPDGDLILALADRYLRKRLPCAFMRWATKKRFDFVANLAREFAVSGVIWYQLQYCETYDIESHFFERKMKEIGMPMLILESDYSELDRGPLKTRIEAFLETIRRV